MRRSRSLAPRKAARASRRGPLCATTSLPSVRVARRHPHGTHGHPGPPALTARSRQPPHRGLPVPRHILLLQPLARRALAIRPAAEGKASLGSGVPEGQKCASTKIPSPSWRCVFVTGLQAPDASGEIPLPEMGGHRNGGSGLA